MPLTSVNWVNNPDMERVFIYGTLKSGHRNGYILDSEGSGARRLSARSVAYGASLYELSCGVPYARLVGDSDYRIEGEVWEVPSSTLRMLDIFEAGYIRKKIKVRLSSSYTPSGVVEMWIYTIPHSQGYGPLSSSAWSLSAEQLSFEKGLRGHV